MITAIDNNEKEISQDLVKKYFETQKNNGGNKKKKSKKSKKSKKKQTKNKRYY